MKCGGEEGDEVEYWNMEGAELWNMEREHLAWNLRHQETSQASLLLPKLVERRKKIKYLCSSLPSSGSQFLILLEEGAAKVNIMLM